MAQKTIIKTYDDLDGTEITESGQTVTFALRDVTYEIDLSQTNIEKLGAALGPFVEKARRVGSRRPSLTTSTPIAVDNTAVRKWAASNGIELSARGRIPAEVIGKYRSAGN